MALSYEQLVLTNQQHLSGDCYGVVRLENIDIATLQQHRPHLQLRAPVTHVRTITSN